MSTRASIKLLVWFGVGLLILSVTSVSFFTWQQQLHAATVRRLVIRNYSLLRFQQRFLSLIRDAESGQRGYLLTGNPAYLEPYRKGAELALPALDELTSLASDDDADARRDYAKVRQLTEEKLAELKQTIQVYNSDGYAKSVSIVKNNSGKVSMDAIYRIMEHRMANGEAVLHDKTAELEMRVKDLERWIFGSAILAVCSILGTASWMIAFLTAKVRAEELSIARAAEARRSQNELSLVLSSIGDGLYRLDQDGRITYLNKAAKSLFGYELEDCVGKSAHDLFHYATPDGTPLPPETCPLIEVVTKGITYASRDTDWFVRKDRTFFPVRCISAPIYDGQKLLGAVVSFTDMSEVRKSQIILDLQHIVSDILADQGTSDDTIRNVIAAVCAKISWDAGAFWRYQMDDDVLVLAAHYAGPTEQLQTFYQESKAFSFKSGEGLPGREVVYG
jgi:PAS domain S-box-containing protein